MSEHPLALIIEDDEDLSIIFNEALHAAGFATVVIRDGQEATEHLAGDTDTPDVIVLDLHLPHVPGTELLTQIRAHPRLKDVQVVITTADARMAEMTEGTADFVLIKPISFSLLRDLSSRLKETLL